MCRRLLEDCQDFLFSFLAATLYTNRFHRGSFSLCPSRAIHVSFLTITPKSRYSRSYAPAGFGTHGLVTSHERILLELSPTNWSAWGSERRIGESVGMSSPDIHWPVPVWNCARIQQGAEIHRYEDIRGGLEVGSLCHVAPGNCGVEPGQLLPVKRVVRILLG